MFSLYNTLAVRYILGVIWEQIQEQHLRSNIEKWYLRSKLLSPDYIVRLSQ